MSPQVAPIAASSRLSAVPRHSRLLLLATLALLPITRPISGRDTGPALVTETLPELLQRGTAAFAAGDFATAAETFAEVERAYGTEPAWTDGPLPERLLPLRGFAELRAGHPEAAAQSLLAFLERYAPEGSSARHTLPSTRNFVRYTLGLALRQLGRHDEALAQFEHFAAANPGTAQAALARFQQAEIHHACGRTDQALHLLRDMADSAPAESLRLQARLRALQLAVDTADLATATELLLGSPWDTDTMPEIGILAFAAMHIGDQLLAAGHPGDAVRAYRLVPTRATLLNAQRANITALQQRLDKSRGAPLRGTFWLDFHRARLARARAQLAALEASEDYTHALRLRLGQAFLLAGRPRQAWLVFEQLTFDETAPENLRAEAQYRWILAAADLRDWEEALAIARDFTRRHPAHPQAFEAFHLIARAHLEQRRFAQAERVLTDLLERFPTHPQADRARFTRGWARTMQEHFEAARADFDRYLADRPAGPLAVNAAFWRALTFFFEHRHEDALEALDALARQHPDDPLRPEIEYRRGTVLYAMREHARALETIDTCLARWPDHPRAAEALALSGDILMAAGRLDEARQRFARLSPDAGPPYSYAVFQTGKILRALGDHDGMIRHFQAYLDQFTATTAPRAAEALHWVAWAHARKGTPAAALETCLALFQRFGDNPQAGDILPAIDTFARLLARIRQSTTETDGSDETANPTPSPGHRDLSAQDFDTWLTLEREKALHEDRLTWYARLALAAAHRHQRRGQLHQYEAALLDIAATTPVDRLDAACLAEVGLALQAIGSPEAATCFRRLLEHHPRSFERAAAWYGLARIALQQRRFDDALRWLARFDAETPTHRLAPRAALLTARIHEQAGHPARAWDAYETVLRLKSARGRPHAEALAGMSRCAVALGQPRKAIACCQRLYTMYRAYHDLVADAYLLSGRLFAELGDPEAATATFREMLDLPDLGDADQRDAARRALEQLADNTAAPSSSTTQPPERPAATGRRST